jgi:preprotein translocase subunit SecD
LHVGRYFLALLALFAALYTTVVFAGDGGKWLTPKLGLDLKGGAEVILTPKTENGKSPTAEQLAAAVGILRQRVDANGVSEAEIVVQGSTIKISVPGGNRDTISKATKAAQMEFRRVVDCQSLAAANGCTQLPIDQVPQELLSTPSATPSTSAGATASPTKKAAVVTPAPTATANKRPISQALQAAASPTPTPVATPSASASSSPDLLLSGSVYSAETMATLNCGIGAVRGGGALPQPNKEIVACDRTGTTKYHLSKATVYGKDIKGATVGTNPTTGEIEVQLSFKGKGQDRWTQLTKDTYNQTPPTNEVAIVLDGIVITAPTTNNIIYGDATITGQFTQKEGQDLANNLKFGALPLTFNAGTVDVVSATLGDDQLRSGLLAGGIGLIAVVIYSLLYYRALGFVTIASLLVSAGLVYGSICVLGDQVGFALSLAGIAGLIVSVGITADSFVVYFERLKDEIKEGRTPRSAVDRAWVRARRTIINADAVSLLAAVILYVVSVGGVRGFAFTLGLSTVLDLAVVFLFTRPLITLLSRYRWFARSRLTGFFGPDGGEPLTGISRAPLAAQPKPQEA